MAATRLASFHAAGHKGSLDTTIAAVVTWLDAVSAAYDHSSAGRLAWLFSPRRVADLPAETDLRQSHQQPNLQRTNRKKLIDGAALRQLAAGRVDIEELVNNRGLGASNTCFRNIARIFLAMLGTTSSSNWASVVDQNLDIVDAWVDAVRSGDLPLWSVSALAPICEFTIEAGDAADENVAALKADMIDDAAEDSAADGGATNEYLQRVLNGIRKHIGKFRGDDAQQGAYMILLSESIRVCLKLKNVQMATAFLKTIPTNQPISPTAPKGPATRFRYFYGNLLLQREQFTQAEDPLVWSFTVCPVKQQALKRSILACLIAVRLRLGRLPPVELLEKYNLKHYESVIVAVRTGNLKLFDDTRKKNSELFYTDGTTLCLDRVKFVVQRVLCERVFHWACRNYFAEGQATNIVPLGLFTAAFKWQCDDQTQIYGGEFEVVEFDDEEMMCVMSNLIKMNFVKGYIAWQQRKLVLSKRTPFPPIRD